MSKALQTITEDEAAKLLTYILKADDITVAKARNIRNYTMTLLMLDAGLRVGEVVKLRRDSLMFNNEYHNKVVIPAEIAKNRMERIVPMTDRLQESVKLMWAHWWILHRSALYDFAFYTTTPGKPLTTRQVQRIIKNEAYNAFGRLIHPHVLRHTFATRLMRKTNIRIVQQLLGHKSLTSTQVYTHPNDQDLKNAIETLNGKDQQNDTGTTNRKSK